MTKHRTPLERFDVGEWTPTPAAVRAAEERTQDMVMVYLVRGARADAVGQLARSCYLQGVQDAVEAIYGTGYEIVRRGTDGEI